MTLWQCGGGATAARWNRKRAWAVGVTQSGNSYSVSTSAASTLPKFNVLRMTNTEVSGESIISAEGLFFGTQVTTNLLLSCIVDCIFMSCEIVRPREDCVAGFASGGIDPFALMRPVLRVPKRR